MVKRNMFFITLVICTSFYSVAIAKDLYVSTNGNDSVSYAGNNISQPWQTPHKAWYSAQAGDTVYFRAGTYTITSMIDLYNAGYHGTAGNYVKIQNYLDEIVTIKTTSVDPMVNLEKSYHWIQGIRFEGLGTIFKVGYDRDANGLKFTKCYFRTTAAYDNSAAILNDTTDGLYVEGCVFYGPGRLNTWGSGVLSFQGTNIIIRNNAFTNFIQAIYQKHRNVDSSLGHSLIENNYLYNNFGVGMRLVSVYTTIRNNLLVNDSIIFGDDGGYINTGRGDEVGADNNIIDHNTFYNGGIDFLYQPQDSDPTKGCLNNTVTNNIFFGRAIAINIHEYSSLTHNTAADFNVYPTGSSVKEFGSSYSLPSWQAIRGGCPTTGNDCNSRQGTPTFVNPTTVSGYSLAPGSLGKNEASDRSDAGADVSKVGTDAILATGELMPPRRLRLQ